MVALVSFPRESRFPKMHATASITMSPRSAHCERTAKSGTLAGGVIAVALHVVIVLVALQFEPVSSAMRAATPVMVRLIAPAPEPSKRETEQSKPHPVKARVRQPTPAAKPPVMTAVTQAPSSFVAPPVALAPLPSVEAMALPAVSAAPAAPTVAAPPAPPAPVVPPSFNADYLDNPAPAYPPLSRRMGEEGKVVLRVFVNEQGLPMQVQLRISSGFSRLDRAALETVRLWKFVPARRGDAPVGAWVLVPISFSLRS
jgi:protein TonB